MINFVRKKIFLLIFAVLLCIATYIRVYGLDRYPEGVLADEASFAYNAYSIVKTGKDEWGKPFPLIFKAFGDQKLPAYVYAIAPLIQVFGMNNIALRLPSAIAGSLFCLVAPILIYTLTKDKRVTIVALLIAAFSPWTITISRFGYESNVALLFFTIGLLCCVKVLEKQQKLYAIMSGFFFGLTWYSYIAYRMSATLFLIPLLTYFVFKKKVSMKIFLVCIISFFITIAPIFPQLFSKTGNARFTQIGLFSDVGPIQSILEKRTFCSQRFPKSMCYLAFNKATTYGELFFKRTIRMYGMEFLFLEGDKELAYLQVADFGQFYLFLIPFYFVGFVSLIMKKRRFPLLLIIWGLICTTLPVILTSNPQKIRASGTLPFFILLLSYGYISIASLFQRKQQNVLFVGFFVFTIISFAFFIPSAFVHIDRYDFSFNTHIAQLMKYLSETGPRKIFINPSFSDPIMMYAYHMKIEPSEYQSQTSFSPIEASGFQHAEKLGEYIEVTDDYCLASESGVLVSNVVRQTPCLKIEKQIYSTNGVHPLLNVYRFVPLEDQQMQ